MSLRPVYGHDLLLSRLEGALASGRFPQAALLVGSPGAGKQRVALWVAQALLCGRGPAPCGACPACRQALGLAHPDLHWFVPIPRPKAGDADRQMAEAQETLGEVMAERRAAGGLWRAPEGMVSHSLASIRLLQRVVGRTPFQARRKVVILGDAERLVVQEASPEAANALLKVLEEPPADTTLLLTAAEPQALLPTIRSRTVPIRVGRVSDEAVRAFLAEELGVTDTGKALARRVLEADGCIGRAVASGEDAADADRRAAEQLLTAIQAGPTAWTARVLGQAPWSARGNFTAMLDALSLKLRDELAASTAAGDAARSGSLATALRRVEGTRAEAQGNLNPQLALATLARELEPLV